MKRFEELNYYELFEIPFDACPFRVRQAYRSVLDTYVEGSLLTYSLFTADEREEILERIKRAYTTLIDANKRTHYNTMLLESGGKSLDVVQEDETSKLIPMSGLFDDGNRSSDVRKAKNKIEEGGVRELLNTMMSAKSISGYDLKELREALGVEFDEVINVTKISPIILQAIEHDEFAKLPPRVYLRSFLSAYAEVLETDPNKVIDGYFKNIHEYTQ